MREQLGRVTLSDRHPERASKEIVSDLWHHMELLLRQEIKLARTDLENKTQHAKRGFSALMLAAAVAHGGYLALLGALFLLLSKRLEPWLSALLIGAFMLATAYAMFRSALHKLAPSELKPEATYDSLEKSVRTMREAIR